MNQTVLQWPKRVLGIAYMSLGLATMLLPDLMIDLSVTDAAQANTLTRLIFQCFGLQATLCGLVAYASEFKRSTYVVLGLAILPVFVFDYWFVVVDPVMTPVGGIADGLFNVLFVTMCAIGAGALKTRHKTG